MADVNGSEQTAARRRPAVLAGLMVAVLLLSVGLAAWIARGRSRPVRRGAEIVEHIRQRRLSAFWPREKQTFWYLSYGRSGRPRGWWLAERRATGDGFAGRRVWRAGSQIHREAWKIDDGAVVCEYQASSSLIERASPGRVPVLRQVSATAITLRGRKVTVRREALGVGQAATGEAPDNYLPEGISPLAYHLTIAGEEPATFAMIFNQQAVLGGRVQFASAKVAPQGSRKLGVTYSTLRGSSSDRITVDENGQVESSEGLDTGESYRRVPQEEVMKAFPEAVLFARPDAPPEPNAPAEPPG